MQGRKFLVTSMANQKKPRADYSGLLRVLRLTLTTGCVIAHRRSNHLQTKCATTFAATVTRNVPSMANPPFR